MKKILLSVFIVFILFGVTGCGKEEEEEQEPTTLTEYFESLKKDVSPYEFKCSVLENNNIIYLDYAYSGSKIFLSNGQVYDAVIGDKTFSNGEQCKQNINYPTVKKVVPFSYEKYFLTTSNDVCKYSKSYSTTSGSQEDDKIECDLFDWLEKKKESKYQYMGDYMNQYSWPEFFHAELDEISYSLYEDEDAI